MGGENGSIPKGVRRGASPVRVASRRHRRFAVNVDEVCRYLFPVGFAVFNGMYWTYYR